MEKTEEVNHKIEELEAAYQNYHKKHKKSSLFWLMSRVFWFDMLKPQTAMLIGWEGKILVAFFFSKVLDSIEADQKQEAYKWALCLGVAILVNLYANYLTTFYMMRFVVKFKQALIGLMCRKISRLSFYSINQVSIGKIVNIAANDLNSVELNGITICILISAPFSLGGALAVLWSFFGVASLTGIVFLFLVNPIQGWLAKLGAKYVSQKNPITDERVKLTNE